MISVVAKSPRMMISIKLHIVRPIVEVVNDTGALVHAIARLDQGIDTVIVKPGPATNHVYDMDIGNVKMEAGAAFCLRALAGGADKLHAQLAIGGRSNPGVPIDEERA